MFLYKETAIKEISILLAIIKRKLDAKAIPEKQSLIISISNGPIN